MRIAHAAYNPKDDDREDRDGEQNQTEVNEQK
jgi:hypothetical protein